MSDEAKSTFFSSRLITGVALMIALGVVAAPLSIPVAGALIYPVQHALNVMAAVILGPFPAVIAATLTATLRNTIGTGTPLAFPGSIFGAFFASLFYRWTGKEIFAGIGELFGTGIIGALVSFPLAQWLLGFSGLAYTFIIPFASSSLAGTVIGLSLLKIWPRKKVSDSL